MVRFVGGSDICEIWGSSSRHQQIRSVGVENAMREASLAAVNFPLASTIRSGTAIWRLLVVMRHAQKTLMTPSG